MGLEHLGEPCKECKINIRWLTITGQNVVPTIVSYVPVKQIGNVQSAGTN